MERPSTSGRTLGRALVVLLVLLVINYLAVAGLRTTSGREFLRRLPYGA